MFTFFLIVQTIVAASLVIVILMQRSEGGGLGVGGSSSGLMTARGAADFLTRATAILAGLFVVLSITLAALAAVHRAPGNIDTSLAQPATAPASSIPGLAPATPTPATATNSAAPAEAPANGTVPIQQ